MLPGREPAFGAAPRPPTLRRGPRLIRGRRAAVWRLEPCLDLARQKELASQAGAFTAPQRVLARGDTRRFDDWCIAVSDVSVTDHIQSTAAAPGKFVVLTLHVFSEARRISQAAPHASVYLLDVQGRRYDVFGPGQEAGERVYGSQPSLGPRLGPRGTFSTVRVFRVPADIKQVDVVTPHGGGPGAFIIGDENSLWHKPTVLRLSLE
jgi:hypothetical protein